jgi:hypothetical protein
VLQLIAGSNGPKAIAVRLGIGAQAQAKGDVGVAPHQEIPDAVLRL